MNAKPYRQFIALCLTALLAFAYGVKPVHVWLAHHDVAAGLSDPGGVATVSTPHHHDCSVCQFEFCSFIEQDDVQLPIAGFDYSLSLTNPVPTALCYYATPLFLLRAPPVLA